jgi:hypothetical protein
MRMIATALELPSELSAACKVDSESAVWQTLTSSASFGATSCMQSWQWICCVRQTFHPTELLPHIFIHSHIHSAYRPPPYQCTPHVPTCADRIWSFHSSRLVLRSWYDLLPRTDHQLFVDGMLIVSVYKMNLPLSCARKKNPQRLIPPVP